MAALRDAHGVDEDVEALLRMAEAKVGIFFDHGEIVARVVGCGPRFTALHLVKDLVHDISLKHGGLRGEQVGSVF